MAKEKTSHSVSSYKFRTISPVTVDKVTTTHRGKANRNQIARQSKMGKKVVPSSGRGRYPKMYQSKTMRNFGPPMMAFAGSARGATAFTIYRV